MRPDYSIIIPAYNEEALLPHTLRRILDLMPQITTHCGEIIVVDNNSDDKTSEIAGDLGVQVVFETHRQIARARNAGAAKARGRYLIFVDADTIISQTLLAKTCAALDAGSCCGGGALIGTKQKLDIAAAGAIFLWNRVSRLFGWAAGSYFFCLDHAFRAVGGFDEKYYASEEIDLSRRLKKWGEKNKLNFTIITEKVDTSMRKLEWYDHSGIFKTALRILIKPSRLRDKDACWLWYRRP